MITSPTKLPPSVNFHFWQPCNMSCRGCFATFEDVRADGLPKGHLPRPDALHVTEELARRFAKITFAGGEPTLCPWLHDLVATAHRQGATTMLVSNGTRTSQEYIAAFEGTLDWLTLSIDSADPATHARMGRAVAGQPLTPEDYCAAADAARSQGIRLKVNTVITAENWDEDLTELILCIRPERWKLLQALPVRGQNDAGIGDLLISRARAEVFVARNAVSHEAEIAIVFEDNDAMTGSYAMVDPAGRFFDNTTGIHRYGPPIADVGVDAAWQAVHFDGARFEARGGRYDW